MSSPADWRDRVDAAVAAAQAARGPLYGNQRYVANFRSAAGGTIRDAAAARGVTTATFVRRATLAMAAEVLQIPFDLVIEQDPTFQWANERGSAVDPSGNLGGPWRIERLR